jgi:hypothetical protein
MDTRERIARKIGSWPITHWVLRKIRVGDVAQIAQGARGSGTH